MKISDDKRIKSLVRYRWTKYLGISIYTTLISISKGVLFSEKKAYLLSLPPTDRETTKFGAGLLFNSRSFRPFRSLIDYYISNRTRACKGVSSEL